MENVELDLPPEEEIRTAVKAFWQARSDALDANKKKTVDIGIRGAVTSGKHLFGIEQLIVSVAEKNGWGDLPKPSKKTYSRLPGYLRYTKAWDVHLRSDNELIAAVECKSQGGSFGKNFNNRAEEVIGSGVDLRAALREGAFGTLPDRPFIGYMMVVEDCEDTRKGVKKQNTNYRTFPDFKGSSYIDRYNILCKRLVSEKIYDAACVVTTPSSAIADGEYGSVEPATSLDDFLYALASHVRRLANAAGGAPSSKGTLWG